MDGCKRLLNFKSLNIDQGETRLLMATLMIVIGRLYLPGRQVVFRWNYMWARLYP
jgi:hypothetical protein